MPRKNPLPARELEIGRRLEAFRRELQHSRSLLALRCGIGSAIIARVETGIVPLKYDVAVSICRTVGLSPLWLATGEEPKRGNVSLLPPEMLDVRPSAIFSEVFDSKLRSEVEAQIRFHAQSDPTKLSIWASIPRTIDGRDQASRYLAAEAFDWISKVPDGYLSEFTNVVIEHGERLIESYAPDPAEAVRQRAEAIRQRRSKAWIPLKALEREPGLPADSVKNNLTTKVEPATSLPMQSTVPKSWKELRADLQALTAERGGKSQLAEDLKVSRQVVTSWLKKKKANEPSADFTLRLLAWVAARKAKQ